MSLMFPSAFVDFQLLGKEYRSEYSFETMGNPGFKMKLACSPLLFHDRSWFCSGLLFWGRGLILLCFCFWRRVWRGGPHGDNTQNIQGTSTSWKQKEDSPHAKNFQSKRPNKDIGFK